VSTDSDNSRAGNRVDVDRWAAGREVLRAADGRIAALVKAEPGLDPDGLLTGLPRDLWGALVLQVIGSRALARSGRGDPGPARGIARRSAAESGRAARHGRRDTAPYRSVRCEVGVLPTPSTCTNVCRTASLRCSTFATSPGRREPRSGVRSRSTGSRSHSRVRVAILFRTQYEFKDKMCHRPGRGEGSR
jgi:hypothetical protein